MARPPGKQARPTRDEDPLGAAFDVMRRELVFDAKAKVGSLAQLLACHMLCCTEHKGQQARGHACAVSAPAGLGVHSVCNSQFALSAHLLRQVFLSQGKQGLQPGPDAE